MLNENQKVFGLGLSKTGTSSLSEALNLLGIKTIHYPSDAVTLRELQGGNYQLTLMQEWQGATDISIAPFFAQLDKAFPDSKFILTVREKESWLRSCEQHWLLMDEWLKNFPETQYFQEFISAVTYGTWKFNRDRFSQVYDNHIESVRKYFKKRKQDFLEIDICNGEGWGEICKFLGYKIPNSSFPRANEWMHLLLEAKKCVDELIPINSRVLLIDQMGFGNTFTPQHQLIPFLEKDGIYWGIPESDAVANAELERMKSDGIEFVAIGFPCFWWLAYYPNFEKNLRRNFESLVENNAVKLFRNR